MPPITRNTISHATSEDRTDGCAEQCGGNREPQAAGADVIVIAERRDRAVDHGTVIAEQETAERSCEGETCRGDK